MTGVQRPRPPAGITTRRADLWQGRVTVDRDGRPVRVVVYGRTRDKVARKLEALRREAGP